VVAPTVGGAPSGGAPAATGLILNTVALDTAPTSAPISAATSPATYAATCAPTSAPTYAATSAPIWAATSASTPVPASAPTSVPTPAATLARSEQRFAERWRLLRQIVTLYGAWLGLSLATGLTARATRSPWLEVVASGLGALLVLGFAIRCRDLRQLLRPRIPSAAVTKRLLGVSIAFVILLSGYYALLHRLGVPSVHYLTEYRSAHWPVWSAFLLISVLPGIVEEIGFRGIIQSSLTRITGAREAWLIQAALFSVLHLSPLIFPDHFVMGLCLGYLRRRSRSLYPGMALHATWNALVLIQELVG